MEKLNGLHAFPAAGQPSPAKTLLHRGPTQGTFSQGLMANRLIARNFAPNLTKTNKVPPCALSVKATVHNEHPLLCLAFKQAYIYARLTVGVSAAPRLTMEE